MSKVIKGGTLVTADREWKADILIEDELVDNIDTFLNSIDDFNIWSKDSHNIQKLSKSRLITPLVKAVQELSAQVTALQAEVTKLKGE